MDIRLEGCAAFVCIEWDKAVVGNLLCWLMSFLTTEIREGREEPYCGATEKSQMHWGREAYIFLEVSENDLG